MDRREFERGPGEIKGNKAQERVIGSSRPPSPLLPGPAQRGDYCETWREGEWPKWAH